MRRAATAAAMAMVLAAGGCELFRVATRPPRAPEAEARRVRFPAFIPAERMVIDGRMLRAVALAMDDLLPEPAPPLPGDADPLSRCLARRDSYDAIVWRGGGGPEPAAGTDGGAIEADAGTDPDGGASDPAAPPPAEDAGRSGSEDIIFVTIFLRGHACPEGDSPVVDAGGTYAIDAVSWRILAIKH